MSDKERMPSADISKLKQSDLDFMKYVESQNRERVERLKLLRRNNIRTASVIGGAVVGIYLYSMLSVKQEKFLDDFDEPVKVIEKH